MGHRLFGFFSGFPSHHFPGDVAERLGKEMADRGSLVFVSAWPEDYARNDDDSAGMYQMFLEYDLSFAQYHVIDNRMEASQAVRLIHEASCVFLMGGHPGLQFQLLRNTGLDTAICDSAPVVLGVSAGAINMAKRSLDTKESPVPYDGLGLADITVKPHFDPENQQVLQELLQISMELPICAMEDDSAIFVMDGSISVMGKIHLIDKGRICPLLQGNMLTGQYSKHS